MIMETITRDNYLKGFHTEKELSLSKMDFIRELFSKDFIMDWEKWFGMMAGNIRESLKKDCITEKELLNGPMGKNILGNTKKENETAKENLF